MSTLSFRRYASAWGGVWYCQRCHHVEPRPQRLQRRRLRVRNHLRHPRLRQGTGACVCACVPGRVVALNAMWTPERSGNNPPPPISRQERMTLKLRARGMGCPSELMCHKYVTTFWSASATPSATGPGCISEKALMWWDASSQDFSSKAEKLCLRNKEATQRPRADFVLQQSLLLALAFFSVYSDFTEVAAFITLMVSNVSFISDCWMLSVPALPELN